MKWWVAQDDSGLIHLFSKEPKKCQAFNKLHFWAVENGQGMAILINDAENCLRYRGESGILQTRMLADILGFKRKGYKKGILYYEGISTKEAREVKIEFNLQML